MMQKSPSDDDPGCRLFFAGVFCFVVDLFCIVVGAFKLFSSGFSSSFLFSPEVKMDLRICFPPRFDFLPGPLHFIRPISIRESFNDAPKVYVLSGVCSCNCD